MRRSMTLLAGVFAAAVAGGPVVAQDLFVYPAKGQSDEQTEKDKFACYQFARKNSGFDPMQAPRASSAPPPQTGGSVAGGAGRGALGGAALGGVVGALTGNTKKGLGIGAASGGLLGGMKSNSRQNQEREARRQWEQQQAARYSANRNDYNRAYAACLEGRGYTVR